MINLDDHTLRQAEHAGRNDAMKRIKALYPMKAFAERDDLGLLRLGYGRQIEHRATSETTADFMLKAELVEISNVLRGRIFPLVAVHPEAASKVGILYALADILGAETMAAWNPLWDALRRADYRAAASELLTANWDALHGKGDDKRRQVLDLVLGIMEPTGATQ